MRYYSVFDKGNIRRFCRDFVDLVTAFRASTKHYLFALRVVLSVMYASEHERKGRHTYTLKRFAALPHFSVHVHVCSAGHVPLIDAELSSTPISTFTVVF